MPDILLIVSDDLVVFDNVLNQVFIITHINPDTQNYEDAQVLNYLIDTVRTCMALGFCLKSHLIALVHLHSFAYLD
jgi:hypothetical protein